MIELTNTVTPSPEQWLAAISGARNAMNSWDRIDSDIREDASESPTSGVSHPMAFKLGEKDKRLLQSLCKAGASHRKFLRMLPSGYNVYATWFANYEVLLNIYHQRKDHRLPDWRAMCMWIEEMPCFKEICLGE